MLSRRGKFYKYTLVPLFCMVLCFCFIGKSVEAATSASWTFDIGSGGGNIQSYSTQANPETYLVSSVATGPDVIINTYNYKFRYTVPVICQFDQGAGADGTYRGGYVNGYIRTNIVLPVTVTGLTGTKTNVRFDAQNALVNNDELYTSIVATVVSGDQVTVRLVTFFNNWSLPQITTSNRYLNLGEIILTYEFEAVEQPTNLTTTITPSLTIPASYTKCTAIAAAGQGMAGQIYSAIENSTSIDDIISFLSLIEDAAGDINVAVAHINEDLLPSVITNLMGIFTAAGNIDIATRDIKTYLYAISSTWPNYSNEVLDYLEMIISMNSSQSSVAEEIESQYAGIANEAATGAAGMEVVMPAVDASMFDINANLDATTISSVTSFWALFTHNSLIGLMFTIAIAGIAAGFFLYGKKG